MFAWTKCAEEVEELKKEEQEEQRDSLIYEKEGRKGKEKKEKKESHKERQYALQEVAMMMKTTITRHRPIVRSRTGIRLVVKKDEKKLDKIAPRD